MTFLFMSFGLLVYFVLLMLFVFRLLMLLVFVLALLHVLTLVLLFALLKRQMEEQTDLINVSSELIKVCNVTPTLLPRCLV